MKHRKARTILLTFAFFALALCTGCGKEYQHISHEEAEHMMETCPDCVIVDVRRQDEYDKRHIQGAILVPIEDIREGKLDALPDKNQTLLLYCWTGRRSEDSAELLSSYGYKNVYEFGGLVDWTGKTESGNTSGDS